MVSSGSVWLRRESEHRPGVVCAPADASCRPETAGTPHVWSAIAQRRVSVAVNDVKRLAVVSGCARIGRGRTRWRRRPRRSGLCRSLDRIVPPDRPRRRRPAGPTTESCPTDDHRDPRCPRFTPERDAERRRGGGTRFAFPRGIRSARYVTAVGRHREEHSWTHCGNCSGAIISRR
jgi:hypothetical protein